MKSRAWLWPVLGVLIAALAWWVLDQDSAADPLDTNEPVVVEEAPPTEAVAAEDRERTEAEPAITEPSHGHEASGLGFGGLLESVKQQFQKEPKRMFRFSGRVLAEGIPVAGAEVLAREARGWGEPDPEAAEVLINCNGACEPRP